MSREQKGSCEIACVTSMHSHFASSPCYQIAVDTASIGNVHLVISLIFLDPNNNHVPNLIGVVISRWINYIPERVDGWIVNAS
jgi:hypothetical protein